MPSDPSSIPTPKLYSYLRFSTPEQSKGDSRRRQLKAAQDYAAEMGLELDESLSDEGISAYRGKHIAEGSALGTFLAAIHIGEIAPGSTLLVENVDRLSRMPVRKTAHLLLGIVNAGIRIVTLEPRKEYSEESLDRDLSAFLELAIQAHRANSESAEKGRRLKDAWDAKRERAMKGEGRKMTASCPPWLTLTPEKDAFVLDEERAKVLRRIFEDTLAGKGAHAIAAELNAAGVPIFSARGTYWRRTYLVTLLRNPAVIGTLVMKDSVFPEGVRSRRVRHVTGEIPAYYPAAIPEDQFRRVQAMQASSSPRRGIHAKQEVQNIFGGIGLCARCGGSVIRINKGNSKNGGQQAHYLVCERAKVGAGCRYQAMRYPMLEGAFLGNLSEILEGAPRGEAIERIDAELANVNAYMSELAMQYEDAWRAMKRGTSPETAQTIRRLEKERDELNAQIKALEEQRSMSAAPIVERRINDLWDACMAVDADRTKINALMRQVFESIEFNPEHFTITAHFKPNGSARPIIYDSDNPKAHGFVDESRS